LGASPEGFERAVLIQGRIFDSPMHVRAQTMVNLLGFGHGLGKA
jgi:hypothetical protein